MGEPVEEAEHGYRPFLSLGGVGFGFGRFLAGRVGRIGRALPPPQRPQGMISSLL